MRKFTVSRLRPFDAGSARTPRRGVTLTEVLVSILIMSIGVISVAALFPIAVLRSAQATTLTSATILKQNAESIVNSFPELVHDPDGDSQPDAFGDDQGIREHFSKNYIVDPLGFYLSRADGRKPEIDAKRFGGVAAAYSAPNANSEQFVWDLCSLPDNFEEVIGGIVDDSLINVESRQASTGNASDVTVLEVTFLEMAGALEGYLASDLSIYGTVDVDEDLNGNGRLDSGEDQNGNNKLDLPFSFTSTVQEVDSNGTATILAPSADFDLSVTPISHVQLNVRDRKYSWMLTVRKNSEGEANGNIAIFFKREFSADDEEIHTAYQYSTDSDGKTVGPEETQPGSTTIRFAPQGDESSRDSPWSPLVRTGSYVLDVDNMHWYRVKSVTEEGGTDSGLDNKNFLEVQLDTPVRQKFSNAMLMRGIVAVFPMSTQGL